ncbi:mediator of RNA polymerase II transcription subunit 8-like [Apostichopus japonicus]|uniref:mediator of RNA polymerase II transcription subunit 8-like n=1 Tax=Stichopus japonicus TaxID=307972 RepID=UPI003AB6D40E
MQPQPKEALDTALENLSKRILDIKKALTTLLFKLETEPDTIQWPSLLDSFALLSGHLNVLTNIYFKNQGSNLENVVLRPLNLSKDPDEQLDNLTERRVQSFSNEVVPNYLRTKPEPATEEKERGKQRDAGQVSQELATSQVSSFNRCIDNLSNLLQTAKESWERDDMLSNRRDASYSNPSDTSFLIQAVTNGKGLKSIRPPGSSPVMSATVPQQIARPVDQHAPMGKAPSSIRTNIKAGSSSNPYQQHK